MDIDILRREIDEIDIEMKKMFLKRMKVAFKIGEYKIANNLPVEDKDREKLIIEKRSEDIEGPLKELYIYFLKNQIDLSKKYQKLI